MARFLTFLFPGQGSQHVGMGGELFAQYPEITAQADEILGYSIAELCQRDPRGELGRTQFTQPALYTVNALTALDLIRREGREPDFVAGHSLGEYNALLAAGAFDFATGLRLVKRRGELMAQAREGGMAAVIGLSAEAIRAVIAEKHPTLDVANYNSPRQIAVSGPREEIEQAGPSFQAAGAAMYIPLPVSGAFHSRYMEPARREFEALLRTCRFAAPRMPVISNLEARPYPSVEAVPALLAAQITGSVRWCEAMQVLLGYGEQEFREVGPGKVLRGLLNKITAEAKPIVLPAPTRAAAAVPAMAIAAGGGSELPASESAATESAPGPRVTAAATPALRPEQLGSATFRQRYGLRLAYLAGAMYRGIASPALVARMGRAGMLGFLGTGGLTAEEIEAGIRAIQRELPTGAAYGANLLCNLDAPEEEERTVDLYLRLGVRVVEAAAYLQVTPALVRYRLAGLASASEGAIETRHHVIAKVSRPEVATAFLSPAPERIVQKLLAAGKITAAQAELAARVPVASDLTIESDSAGHTDQGVAFVLLPAMRALRDELVRQHGYAAPVHLGAAGGIGAPAAAAAAFVLGADYVQTGSINQCTVEAAISDTVKDLLEGINVQDTAYAPAGDMFEIGARVQVLKKGLFFAPRANKLYDLYRAHDSLEQIDEKTRRQIEEKYFGRSFDEIWRETATYLQRHRPADYERALQNPKQKMALVFRWYFGHSTRLAFAGDPAKKLDYQVHCGPALGAFNQWVKGTPLARWRERHVDDLAERIMAGAAAELTGYLRQLGG